jgi:hypothetical protein
MCLACVDAWLSYAVTERGALFLFLQFSSKLLVEVFVLACFPTDTIGSISMFAIVLQGHDAFNDPQ